jgi:transcriptional antiterminator
MIGYKQYELEDAKNISKLNKLLKPFGISFETNLLGVYVLIDMDKYWLSVRRKAGRRTVITQDLRYKVFALKGDHKSLREIARQTGVSTSTVSKILKDWEEEKETEQLRFDF